MAIGISFFLTRSKSSTPVTIRCQINYTPNGYSYAVSRRLGIDPIRHTFNTCIKVDPKTFKDGRLKNNHPNAPQINAELENIRDRSATLHRLFVKDAKFPHPEKFAQMIMQPTEVEHNDFFLRYSQYIEYLENKAASKTFIYKQKACFKIMQAFQNDERYILDFSETGRTFAAKFITWFLRQGPKQNRPKQNLRKTGESHILALKKFLNYAISEQWTTATAHKTIKITHQRAQIFPVTLTEQEILALYNADLPEKTWQITRDWFVFATQTAIRYSDWDGSRLKFVKVPTGTNMRFVQAKTINPLEIPLSDLALKIAEKYNFQMPRKYTSAATGRHLKAACALAGIDKEVNTHTARRTFCTLMEAKGIPRQIIMRISGHQTEKDYLRYLGVSYEYNAELMRRANPDWFVKSA